MGHGTWIGRRRKQWTEMVKLDWLECLRHQQEVVEEVKEEMMMEVLGQLEWKGVETVVERLLWQLD